MGKLIEGKSHGCARIRRGQEGRGKGRPISPSAERRRFRVGPKKPACPRRGEDNGKRRGGEPERLWPVSERTRDEERKKEREIERSGIALPGDPGPQFDELDRGGEEWGEKHGID